MIAGGSLSVTEFVRARHEGTNNFMTQATSMIATSDELSSDVATAILTRQNELNRDPRELLDIVMTVHNTLRELSESALESRYRKVNRFACGSR